LGRGLHSCRIIIQNTHFPAEWIRFLYFILQQPTSTLSFPQTGMTRRPFGGTQEINPVPCRWMLVAALLGRMTDEAFDGSGVGNGLCHRGNEFGGRWHRKLRECS
jgi:hypothetical protein